MKANRINIPSKETCDQIISSMGMLDNIAAHCRQVCRVSLLLTDQLGIAGLNRELIMAAALLHDITKTRSFHTKEDHAETGSQMLKALGYPEVAEIIGQHVHLYHNALVSEAPPTDAQIVNYADKRVLHDKIVPLNDRMEYILERYGDTQERKRKILILWENTRQLEERLFTCLPFSPDDIDRMLSAESAFRNRTASTFIKPVL